MYMTYLVACRGFETVTAAYSLTHLKKTPFFNCALMYCKSDSRDLSGWEAFLSVKKYRNIVGQKFNFFVDDGLTGKSRGRQGANCGIAKFFHFLSFVQKLLHDQMAGKIQCKKPGLEKGAQGGGKQSDLKSGNKYFSIGQD